MFPCEPAMPEGPWSDNAVDAIAILQRDLRLLDNLFSELARAADTNTRSRIVGRMAREFEVLAKLERQFYRWIERSTPDLEADIQRGRRELGARHRLFQQLGEASPDGPEFAQHAQAVRDALRQHGKRNAIDLYAAVRSSSVDLRALGAAMSASERALRSSFGP